MSMVMTDMMDTAPAETWTFGGVETLNGTQIPDAYFDEVMAPLGPSAFTVLMYVARRTFGFKRHSDQISLDQICHGIVAGEVRDADGIILKPARRLDHGTGLAKSTVVRALDRLIAAGLIHKRKNTDPQRGQLANTYAIVFKDPAAATPAPLPLSPQRTAPLDKGDSPPVSRGDTPCRAIAQAPVADVDTQQTVETTNSRRQTDISKRGKRTMRSHSHLDSNDSMTVTTEMPPIKPPSTSRPTDPGLAPIGAHMARLSAEFGDDAPQASRTRVLNIQRVAGLGDDVLRQLLDEAAMIARSQAPTITKRGRDGTVIRMPYLLATFQSLVGVTNDPIIVPPVPSAPSQSSRVTPNVSPVDDPPAATEATVLWRAVLDEVRQDVTAENYTTWFAPTRALHVEGRVLRVSVPTPFHAQWLEHKLRGCVDRALGHMGHAGVRIAYEVGTPADRASVSDQAVDQAAVLVPPIATIVPRPSASPRETPAFVRAPRPGAASSAVPPPVVACPSCRAAPCRCRLTDPLQRTISARILVAQAAP